MGTKKETLDPKHYFQLLKSESSINWTTGFALGLLLIISEELENLDNNLKPKADVDGWQTLPERIGLKRWVALPNGRSKRRVTAINIKKGLIELGNELFQRKGNDSRLASQSIHAHQTVSLYQKIEFTELE